MKASLNLLSKEEIEWIHKTTLYVLERVGVKVLSDRILKIFIKNGLEADLKKKVVKIPEDIVQESIKKTPKHFVLHGRNPKYDMIIEEGRSYFGLGGTPPPYILDSKTLEFRRSTKEDVANGARLGDALENISFLMTIAGAYDVPCEVQYLHEYEAIVNNTEKPVVYPAPGGIIAKYMLGMAAEVVGGVEQLIKRPILALYSEPPPPLMLAETDENLLEFAKLGIPIALGPTAMAGSTGPITIAGSAVISNAQALSAITLVNLINPQTPILYACWVAATDPLTGRHAYGSPEFALSTSVVNSQMARYYGIPCFGFAGCPDSTEIDVQAGAEAMMMTLMNTLSGVNLMHDCGYIAGGDAGSMEMAVICNEICGIALKIAKGFTVNNETLAFNVIEEVGPGGHFLSHKHTLKFLEAGEIFVPKLFTRMPLIKAKRSKRQIIEVVRDRVKELLSKHHPDPLSKDVRKKLQDTIKEAEKRLVKSGV